MSPWDIIIRLVMSTLLGGAIGLERESLNRPAGFRTHILVCIGSTLIMLLSFHIFEEFVGRTNLDPARLSAQVISGIGFLGAGTILKEGLTVKGLTTAASLWTVAGIGLAIGAGFYIGAITTTFIVFLTLVFFSRVEGFIVSRKQLFAVHMIIDDIPGQLGKIGTALGSKGIGIYNIQMDHENECIVSIKLLVRVPSKTNPTTIIDILSNVSGIRSIEIEN
jgi:putative Mg2+ transporter-C (MgtC) family protein